jgi:hypothetical protein
VDTPGRNMGRWPVKRSKASEYGVYLSDLSRPDDVLVETRATRAAAHKRAVMLNSLIRRDGTQYIPGKPGMLLPLYYICRIKGEGPGNCSSPTMPEDEAGE